jgi:hypothetical protein
MKLSAAKKKLGLDSTLYFGKYSGLTIQDIIDDGNANYIHWAIDNISDFELTNEAFKALPAFDSRKNYRFYD